MDGFLELIKKDYIRPYAPGSYFWTPKGAKLLYGIFKMFEQEVLISAGYSRAIFPKRIKRSSWDKSRHSINMANEIFILSKIEESYEGEVVELKKSNKLSQNDYEKRITPTKYGYCHSVCTPVYELFANKRVEETIKWYDFSGVSLRNEKSPQGLQRLREFHMVDAVMVGKESEVRSARKNLIELYKKIFNKLGIEYLFFLKKVRDTPEKFDDYRVVPNLIDFQAFVPHSKNWLEVGSSFLHGSQFTKRFEIENVTTSCGGIGLDRWVEVLVSYHNFDFPEILIKYLE